jgi:hypothetical protein
VGYRGCAVCEASWWVIKDLKEIGLGLLIWNGSNFFGPILVWLVIKIVLSTAFVQNPSGFKVMGFRQLGQLVWLHVWLGSLVIIVSSPWIPIWGTFVGLVTATIVCSVVAKRKGLSYQGNP